MTTLEGSGAARRLAPRRERSSARSVRTIRSARELDAQVIARATLVCCDSIEDAKLESGDLIEPVAAGQLDWLEVHELHEIVAGEVPGRQADADIVVFKSNGIAPWDVAIAPRGRAAGARERGVGVDALRPLFLAEDDLLRALPEELLPERAEVLVALDDRREVVPGELAGLRGEVDVAVREQDLRLRDAAGVEDDLARVADTTSRSPGRARGRGRRTGSSRPRPTSGRG